MEKLFSLDKPQTIHFNKVKNIDLGAAAASAFFSRLFDWCRLANLENKKIRVVIEYDPINGSAVATFSKAN